MWVIGLTGGMGAGKSTVARLFAERGAVVVDADEVARDVVEPGEPALEAIRERFGDDVIAADGSLDRAALAAVVFADDDARGDLEDITHPAIRARISERLRELAADDATDVVVVDHPLLVESGLASRFPTVVVVEAPVELRLARLERDRGVDRDDARARMRAQADDAERRAVADHVIVNDRDLAHLARRVEEVLADGPPPGASMPSLGDEADDHRDDRTARG